jgi:hypothetical protein
MNYLERFERFKASHPIGTKVKIVRKVQSADHYTCKWNSDWMNSLLGKSGIITGYNTETVDVMIYRRYPELTANLYYTNWQYLTDCLETKTYSIW